MEIKQGKLFGTCTDYTFKTSNAWRGKPKHSKLEIGGSWSQVEKYQAIYPEFYHFMTRNGYEGVFWKRPIFDDLIVLISTKNWRGN